MTSMRVFITLCAILTRSGVEAQCFGQSNTIEITRNSSISSSDSSIDVCHWKLNPPEKNYVVKITTKLHIGRSSGEIKLYAVDGRNVCPVFGTECLQHWTHEGRNISGGSCDTFYERGRPVQKCKVKKNSSTGEPMFRICNACFSGTSFVNLVRNTEYCYQTCKNSSPASSCFVTKDVPAVIQYRTEARSPLGFDIEINFEPCIGDPPATSAFTTSSQVLTTADILTTSVDVTDKQTNKLDPGTTTNATQRGEDNDVTNQTPPASSAAVNLGVVLGVSVPAVFLFLAVIAIVIILCSRKAKLTTTEVKTPEAVYEEISLDALQPSKVASTNESVFFSEEVVNQLYNSDG